MLAVEYVGLPVILQLFVAFENDLLVFVSYNPQCICDQEIGLSFSWYPVSEDLPYTLNLPKLALNSIWKEIEW